MAYSVPAPYAQAVRNGLALSYTVDASTGGVPIAGATGMAPTGGTITDTIKPGVRRNLSLELAPEPGLKARLSTYGTTLTVSCTVTYTNKHTVSIPMGVFDVDARSLSYGGGKLSLTAPDKWVRIQRANFLGPTPSVPGIKVTDQIVIHVQGALGSSEPVIVNATSTATVGTMTWDPAQTTRAQAIMDLAAGIGAWVYFDRNGVCHIDDIPTVKPSADWLIDASASGVLVSLNEQSDRTHTYNVVVVGSSASGGPAFSPVTVWDNDPNSPTFAGTANPITTTGGAGPFGVVVYHWSTPLQLSSGEATTTAYSILSKTVGLTSTVALSSVPNPAIDSFDAIDVLPPPERKDLPLVMSRHVVDTVTHQLDVGQAQTIQGRSTRTDSYT